MIGNTLYACTPTNQVFALRGDTGEELWHYNPEVTVKDIASWSSCRSLAYLEVPALPADAIGKKRIYLTTGTMRLIALDAFPSLKGWARSIQASPIRHRGRCLPEAISLSAAGLWTISSRMNPPA